jgi:hypothetical protein
VSIRLVVAVGLLGGTGLAGAVAVAQSGAARRRPAKEGVKPARKAQPPGPPRTWKEHWFEHDRVIKLVSSNDDVGVYFDDDVPRGGATAWIAPFMTPFPLRGAAGTPRSAATLPRRTTGCCDSHFASSASLRGGSGRPQEPNKLPQVPPRNRRATRLPFRVGGVGRRGRADGEGRPSGTALLRRRQAADGVEDQEGAT